MTGISDVGFKEVVATILGNVFRAGIFSSSDRSASWHAAVVRIKIRQKAT